MILTCVKVHRECYTEEPKPIDCTYVNTVDIIAAHLADLIEQAEAHVLQSQQVDLPLDKKQLSD